MLRSLGTSFAASLLFLGSARAQDRVRELFDEGVNLLRRGEDEEALKKFQDVLKEDPSQEAAYQLWRETDHAIWLKMLVKSGEYESVAKRLMSLASLGRKAKKDDAAAVGALVEGLKSPEAAVRRDAILKLSAEHGEYAVPYLLPALGSPDDPDFRVVVMHALVEMSGDVVLPLREALRSDSAVLRRSAAAVLGRLGDRRALGALRALAEADSEEAVRKIAADALASMGSGPGSARDSFLEIGRGYLGIDAGRLREIDVSDVVWNWEGGALSHYPVPRVFYSSELARGAFHDALASDPSSTDAMAGIAYSYAAQEAELDSLKASGADLSSLEGAAARIAEGSVSLAAAGPAMLDGALGWARKAGDAPVAVALIEAMGASRAPSAGVVEALADPDKRVRYAAAIALGGSMPSGGAPGLEGVPAVLAAAVAEEVVRIVHLIDENAARRDAAAEALGSAGFFVVPSDGGATGLARLRRAPGADLVAVSASLSDVTTDQVIDEVREDFRTSGVPILVVADAAAAERAQELYGGKASKVVAALDAASATEAASGAMNADRERAADLARRAAAVLAHLSPAAYDLSGASSVVVGCLAQKGEAVTVPALHFLGNAAGGEGFHGCAELFAEAARTGPEKVAAAHALGQIFARTGAVDSTAVNALRGGLKDGDLAVRRAAAAALGRANLSAADRATLLAETRAALKAGEKPAEGGAAKMEGAGD